MDTHHAARSGQKREQQLSELIASFGYTLKEKQRINDIPSIYSQCGFKFFWDDGSIPELNIDHIELKGGNAKGTTQEKLFFDLEKIKDGVYNGNLLYIFEGIMETHPCTKLFLHKLNQLNCENVQVLMYSQLDADSLREVFK
jgi:hypothetical protein